MSGLAGAVTGKSMRELWVEEIAEPLGTDELSLGAPPKSSDMVVAEFVDPFLVGESPARLAALGGEQTADFAGCDGRGRACRTGQRQPAQGDDPALFDAQMPAANGVASARAFCAGLRAAGHRRHSRRQAVLVPEAVRSFEAPYRLRLDRALGIPMSWNPASTVRPSLSRTASATSGSTDAGWADPATGLSVGFCAQPPPVDDGRRPRLPLAAAVDQQGGWQAPAADGQSRASGTDYRQLIVEGSSPCRSKQPKHLLGRYDLDVEPRCGGDRCCCGSGLPDATSCWALPGSCLPTADCARRRCATSPTLRASSRAACTYLRLKESMVDELLRGFLDGLFARYREIAAAGLSATETLRQLVIASFEAIDSRHTAVAIYQNEARHPRVARPVRLHQRAQHRVPGPLGSRCCDGVAEGDFRSTSTSTSV